jgi:hypothetical protein
LARITALFVPLLTGILFLADATDSFSQGPRRVIQLSGIVLGEDSVSGIPGVHIWVPRAGYGTPTNRAGYFSLPVLVGDSVVVSAVGYQRRHFTIPANAPEFLTLVIDLTPDVTYLDEIEIRPFPTEEVFKQAVLAMNLPVNAEQLDSKSLNDELMSLMLRTTPMDNTQNYRYYIDTYMATQSAKYQPVSNPFLNPFNWARFFRDLKAGKK